MCCKSGFRHFNTILYVLFKKYHTFVKKVNSYKKHKKMKRLFVIFLCGMFCAAGCNKYVELGGSDEPDQPDLVIDCSASIASGTTGPLSWVLCTDGTLFISGKGEMPDYYTYSNDLPFLSIPWYECRTDVTNVIIGNNVSKIGNSAFNGCINLASVTIGNSVKIIGGKAFAGCDKLTSVKIPNSVKNIDFFAFLDCGSLTSVTIPNSVTTIGASAFLHCSSLTSVTIGNSVTTIGELAFGDCISLTEIINYQKTPQVINEYVFRSLDKNNCTLLVPTGTIEAYRVADGWKGFRKTGEIGNTGSIVTHNPNGTTGPLTWSLSADGTLVISGKGAMLDYSTESTSPWYEFRNDITKVVIGNDVSHIGSNAFYWHNNLASATIGSSVTTIGDCAFQFCYRLTEIINYQKIPQIVSEIWTMGEHWGTFGRVYKPNCTLWVLSGSVEAYRAADVWNGFHKTGVISDPSSIPPGIGGMEKHLKWVLSDDGILTISGKGNMPFYNIYGTRHSNSTHPEWYWIANSISHVVIEEGVSSISNYAFYGCGNLNTISIPSTVEYFYASTSLSFAFINVATDNPFFSSIDGVLFNKSQTVLILYPSKKQDKSYIIPDGVTFTDYPNSSGYCAYPFANCIYLTSITIPNSITNIDNLNFWYCTSLTEIIIHQATPQTIYNYTFYGVNKDKCILYVPAGSIEAYRAADGWKDFVNIKAIQ